ncbi:hypothetical protein D3C85_274590 [compost metagenome]
MNDRELLENAAKAAGYDVSWGQCITGIDVLYRVDEEGDHVNWSPLEDDGDAIRLAVIMEFDLSLGQAGTIVHMRRGTQNIEEYSDELMMEAFRRSIVRAAAEIGKKQTPH